MGSFETIAIFSGGSAKSGAPEKLRKLLISLSSAGKPISKPFSDELMLERRSEEHVEFHDPFCGGEVWYAPVEYPSG
jgi:hypothetical protein